MEATKTWDLTLPSLHKTYANYFKIGNILSPHDWNDSEKIDMFRHHYNSMTAENSMKPVYITKAPGEYDFSKADMMVKWAEENGIQIIGHTLVWHAQSPDWFTRTPEGASLTRAEAKANMESFIKTYVGRYSGKVYSWDVINEAFIDSSKGDFSGNWRDYIRRETDNPRAVGHWFLAYANGADASKGEHGSDYVFDSFYFTRKYDPKAILYYNDYNEEFGNKRNAIYHMVMDINAIWKAHPEYDGRLLVEGIGMQGHHNHKHTELKKIRKALELFSKTGAKISVTEMDFTFGSPENPSNPLSTEESRRQAEMYGGLFELYKEFSQYVERVTLWGVNDGQSWRDWGSPVLFDANGAAKEAFNAIIKVGGA